MFECSVTSPCPGSFEPIDLSIEIHRKLHFSHNFFKFKFFGSNWQPFAFVYFYTLTFQSRCSKWINFFIIRNDVLCCKFAFCAHLLMNSFWLWDYKNMHISTLSHQIESNLSMKSSIFGMHSDVNERLIARLNQILW